MFTSICYPGYWIRYINVNDESLSQQKYKHLFCGKNILNGAVSRNSGRPLLQLAKLDTKDLHICLGDSGVDFIYLLYSWTCDISQGRFVYEQNQDDVKILEYCKGDAYDDFPYRDYPSYFPERLIELVAITDAEQKMLTLINQCNDRTERFKLVQSNLSLAIPRHQIGGEPFLLCGSYLPTKCSKCKKEMMFLASIGNDNGVTHEGFCGNDFVQLIYEICVNCRVIAVDQFSD